MDESEQVIDELKHHLEIKQMQLIEKEDQFQNLKRFTDELFYNQANEKLPNKQEPNPKRFDAHSIKKNAETTASHQSSQSNNNLFTRRFSVPK